MRMKLKFNKNHMCALGCDSVGKKFKAKRRSFGIGSTRAMAQANALNNCLQSHTREYLNE